MIKSEPINQAQQPVSYKRNWLSFLAVASFIGVCVVVIFQYIIPLVVVVFCSLIMFYDTLQGNMRWLEGILNYYSIVTCCSFLIMSLAVIGNFIVLLKIQSLEKLETRNRNLLWVGGSSLVILLIAMSFVLHLSLPRQNFLVVAALVATVIFNSKLGDNIRIRNLSAKDVKLWRIILMVVTGVEVLLLVVMALNFRSYDYQDNNSIDSNSTVLDSKTLNI